ncbi:RNA-directed DNA polymerase, eukaryota [Tanacetum coccineum]
MTHISLGRGVVGIGGVTGLWKLREVFFNVGIRETFTCKEAMGDERFIAIKGEWKGKVGKVFLVCIYRPHVRAQKASLWGRIAGLMEKMGGAWCIFGDLNMISRWDDRLNSQINVREMNDFNEFINDARLVEKIEEHKKETMRWELEAENRSLNESERAFWLGARSLWVEKDKELVSMMRQKARIKWDVEGGENSKFFHAYVKRRNNKNNIRVEKISTEDARSLEQESWKRKFRMQFVVVGEIKHHDRMVLISGGWSKDNAKSFMCILKFFEEVSGLRMNLNKRKIYRVVVNDTEIDEMARWLRCGVGEFPFTYLGLPIGENMGRIGAWRSVIDDIK